jgi:hypothetical protein
MTQPNVTSLSVPAGPRNNSAFVSATTAPPTFVFRPGAVFPPGGIGVQQNVFTSPVTTGADGLVILQGVLAGNGLAPAIPLPSSTVQFDFSLTANAFSLTSNVSFGLNCTLEGLLDQATRSYPVFTSNGHTFSGVTRIDNTTVEISVATGVTTPPAILLLRGATTIESLDGNLYSPAITAGTPLTIDAFDATTIGDGTHAVWNVNAGGTLTVNAYDALQLKAGALSTAGGGDVIINVYSPGVFIDPSYTTEPRVTINTNYTTSSSSGLIVTFQPGGVASGTTFTTFASLCTYIASIGTDVEKWVIQIDGSFTAGSPSIASGVYALPDSVEFVGLANPAYGFPTLSGGSDVVFNPAPTDLTFRNIPFIEFLNISTPLITVTGTLDVYVFNCYLFGNLWFSAVTGGFVNVTLDTYASINATLIIRVDATSSAVVGALPGTTVGASAITVIEGGTCAIYVTDSVSVDPSYFTTSGITVAYLYAPSSIVTFAPGGTAGPTVFTDLDQLAGYVAAVGTLVQEWTVQLDFSDNGNAYSLTDNVSLGPNTTLVGIRDRDDFPTLFSNGFTVTGIVGFDGINLFVSTTPFIADSPEYFRFTDSTLLSTDGTFFYVPSENLTIDFFNTTIGDGTNNVVTGSNTTANLYQASSLMANSLDLDGTFEVNVYDPSVLIDPTLFELYTNQVTFATLYLASPVVTLGPSISTNPGTGAFNNETELSGYIFSSQIERWTIYVDLGGTGTNSYTFTATLFGSYAFGTGVSKLQGVFNGVFDSLPYPDPPTLETNGSVFYGIGEFQDLTINISISQLLVDTNSILVFRGQTSIGSSDGNYFFSFIDQPGTTVTCTLYDRTIFGDGVNAIFDVLDACTLIVDLYGASAILENAITVAAGGTLTINVYDSAVFIDPSYFSLAGVTVTYAHGVVIANSFATPNGNVTASPGALYTSSAGGVGSTLWYKATGVATNTGWQAVA